MVATVERGGGGPRRARPPGEDPRPSRAGGGGGPVRRPPRWPRTRRACRCRRMARTSPSGSRRAAATRGDFDAWARHWVLEPATHEQYLEPAWATTARRGCERRTDPESWRAGRRGPSRRRRARRSALGARRGVRRRARWRPGRCPPRPTPCWPARASPTWPPGWPWLGPRRRGASLELTAELGLWGYTPTPADPYIFNHRVFPGAPMLADASTVLGMVVGGPGTRTVALPGRGPGRPGRQPQLDPHPRRAVPGRVGGRQRRGQPRRGAAWWCRWPAPSAWWSGSVTSPARARVSPAWSPTWACCAASTACCASRRCRAAPSPWHERVRRLGGGVRLGRGGGDRRRGARPRHDRRGAGPAALRPRAPVPVVIAGRLHRSGRGSGSPRTSPLGSCLGRDAKPRGKCLRRQALSAASGYSDQEGTDTDVRQAWAGGPTRGGPRGAR